MKNIFSQISKRISELGTKRSPKWERARRIHLATEGWCRYCGSVNDLQVHHMVPFHDDPSRELDPSNLITLCETSGVEHHLIIGHFRNWKNFNPNVAEECKVAAPTIPTALIL